MKKTSRLDTLISNKESQINNLEEIRKITINQAVTKGLNPKAKLKPSRTEWLGEIPEHWEVKRLKNIGKIKYGLGQPPKEKENGLPLIRATNISRGKIYEAEMMYVDPNDIPYERDPILKVGDIIVVRSGAYTADSAIIPKGYENSIAGYDMVIRIDHTFNNKFISYCLLSKYILNDQMIILSLRAAQPHLNKEELGSVLISLPPLNEQIAIANYLDEKTSRLDTLISNLKDEIESLKEIRKITIQDAVTGKVKVS
jgi:type I restriction enzyme, S subunit